MTKKINQNNTRNYFKKAMFKLKNRERERESWRERNSHKKSSNV